MKVFLRWRGRRRPSAPYRAAASMSAVSCSSSLSIELLVDNLVDILTEIFADNFVDILTEEARCVGIATIIEHPGPFVDRGFSLFMILSRPCWSHSVEISGERIVSSYAAHLDTTRCLFNSSTRFARCSGECEPETDTELSVTDSSAVAPISMKLWDTLNSAFV